jgi:hypothetical protein
MLSKHGSRGRAGAAGSPRPAPLTSALSPCSPHGRALSLLFASMRHRVAAAQGRGLRRCASKAGGRKAGYSALANVWLRRLGRQVSASAGAQAGGAPSLHTTRRAAAHQQRAAEASCQATTAPAAAAGRAAKRSGSISPTSSSSGSYIQLWQQRKHQPSPATAAPAPGTPLARGNKEHPQPPQPQQAGSQAGPQPAPGSSRRSPAAAPAMAPSAPTTQRAYSPVPAPQELAPASPRPAPPAAAEPPPVEDPELVHICCNQATGTSSSSSARTSGPTLILLHGAAKQLLLQLVRDVASASGGWAAPAPATRRADGPAPPNVPPASIAAANRAGRASLLTVDVPPLALAAAPRDRASPAQAAAAAPLLVVPWAASQAGAAFTPPGFGAEEQLVVSQVLYPAAAGPGQPARVTEESSGAGSGSAAAGAAAEEELVISSVVYARRVLQGPAPAEGPLSGEVEQELATGAWEAAGRGEAAAPASAAGQRRAAGLLLQAGARAAEQEAPSAPKAAGARGGLSRRMLALIPWSGSLQPAGGTRPAAAAAAAPASSPAPRQSLSRKLLALLGKGAASAHSASAIGGGLQALGQEQHEAEQEGGSPAWRIPAVKWSEAEAQEAGHEGPAAFGAVGTEPGV